MNQKLTEFDTVQQQQQNQRLPFTVMDRTKKKIIEESTYPTTYKRDNTRNQMGFISGMLDLFYIESKPK